MPCSTTLPDEGAEGAGDDAATAVIARHIAAEKQYNSM